MNENIYQTETGEDYSKMNLTQQLRAKSNAEVTVTEIPTDTRRDSGTETAPTTEENSAPPSEDNTKKSGKSKKTSLKDRRRKLKAAQEQHIRKTNEIGDELSAINKELHDCDIAELDALCVSKGIDVTDLINLVRNISDRDGLLKLTVSAEKAEK